MLFYNIKRTTEECFHSLYDEVGVERHPKLFVRAVFWGIPAIFGTALGLVSPIWGGIVAALASTIGILTGFSINAIVLLTGYSENDGYELKTNVVDKTKNITLYSIFLGVSLLIILILGLVITRARLPPGVEIPMISGMQAVSIAFYVVLTHYFMILLVITHRLYSLVHSDALN